MREVLRPVDFEKSEREVLSDLEGIIRSAFHSDNVDAVASFADDAVRLSELFMEVYNSMDQNKRDNLETFGAKLKDFKQHFARVDANAHSMKLDFLLDSDLFIGRLAAIFSYTYKAGVPDAQFLMAARIWNHMYSHDSAKRSIMHKYISAPRVLQKMRQSIKIFEDIHSEALSLSKENADLAKNYIDCMHAVGKTALMEHKPPKNSRTVQMYRPAKAYLDAELLSDFYIGELFSDYHQIFMNLFSKASKLKTGNRLINWAIKNNALIKLRESAGNAGLGSAFAGFFPMMDRIQKLEQQHKFGQLYLDWMGNTEISRWSDELDFIEKHPEGLVYYHLFKDVPSFTKNRKILIEVYSRKPIPEVGGNLFDLARALQKSKYVQRETLEKLFENPEIPYSDSVAKAYLRFSGHPSTAILIRDHIVYFLSGETNKARVILGVMETKPSAVGDIRKKLKLFGDEDFEGVDASSGGVYHQIMGIKRNNDYHTPDASFKRTVSRSRIDNLISKYKFASRIRANVIKYFEANTAEGEQAYINLEHFFKVLSGIEATKELKNHNAKNALDQNWKNIRGFYDTDAVKAAFDMVAYMTSRGRSMNSNYIKKAFF